MTPPLPASRFSVSGHQSLRALAFIVKQMGLTSSHHR